MKKSDLKTGMWVEYKNGKTAIVLLDTEHGDIVSGHDTWQPITNLNCDEIVKVYQPDSNMDYMNNEFNGTTEDETYYGIKGGLKIIWQRDDKAQQLKEVISNLKEQLRNAECELEKIRG